MFASAGEKEKPEIQEKISTDQTTPRQQEIAGDSFVLEEFLTENRSWMKIKAGISGVNLQFSGNVNLVEAHRSLALKANFSGENLNSLNDLLQLHLPPLKDYSVETDLFVKKDQFVMENLIVKTGSSSLKGTAKITQDADNVEAVIEFSSPLIQLNDFIFDDWSWSGEKTEAGSTAEDGGSKETAESKEEDEVAGKSGSPGGVNRELLDPELLDRFDVTLSVHAEQVLSGEDQLGSGFLKTTLHDGRIAIEPLELKIPGGSIEVAASVKPGPQKSDAALKAVMSNFDIGIWVRRSKPESEMGGLVNLDIDLPSSAASPKELLENGTGYFDFSGNLENFSAGIIDLWAVNLVAAIVSSTDKEQSTINCAVGRWSVEDGLLTPDMFFIDTSKIRICGKGQIDLKKERIDLVIAPSAKKPEFFNLATPLKVYGTIDDINFGVKQGAIVGTAVRFITSPVMCPFKESSLKGCLKTAVTPVPLHWGLTIALTCVLPGVSRSYDLWLPYINIFL